MFMFATCEFVRMFEVMVVFVKHQITAMCFNKSFISTASTVLVFYNYDYVQVRPCNEIKKLSEVLLV